MHHISVALQRERWKGAGKDCEWGAPLASKTSKSQEGRHHCRPHKSSTHLRYVTLCIGNSWYFEATMCKHWPLQSRLYFFLPLLYAVTFFLPVSNLSFVQQGHLLQVWVHNSCGLAYSFTLLLLYKSCHMNITLFLSCVVQLILLAGYLDSLQRAVNDRLSNASGAPSGLRTVPPPLTSSVGPVDKVAAVQAFWTRFDRS